MFALPACVHRRSIPEGGLPEVANTTSLRLRRTGCRTSAGAPRAATRCAVQQEAFSREAPRRFRHTLDSLVFRAFHRAVRCGVYRNRTAPYDSTAKKNIKPQRLNFFPKYNRGHALGSLKFSTFAKVRVWCGFGAGLVRFLPVFTEPHRTAPYDLAFDKTAPNRTVGCIKNRYPHRTAPHLSLIHI